MPLRVRTDHTMTIWDDANQTNQLFKHLRSQLFDTFQRHTAKHVAVTASTTEAVDLGDFQAVANNRVRGLRVEANADCTLNIDFGSGAVAIPLTLPSTATGTMAEFFVHGQPTSLTITAGSAAVEALVVAFGAAAS